MEDYFLMMISAMFINNIALIRFMGNCPIVGVSSSMNSAIGMSFAVIFVTTLAGTTCWIIQKSVLEVFNLEYLQTLVFILVIASNVQITEMVVQKVSPPLYRALGIYLPLITTNCMVFGISLLNIQDERTFIETLVYSISAAVGFAIVLIVLAAIRERMAATANVPAVLQGVPITLITAGIMALSFAGLMGID